MSFQVESSLVQGCSAEVAPTALGHAQVNDNRCHASCIKLKERHAFSMFQSDAKVVPQMIWTNAFWMMHKLHTWGHQEARFPELNHERFASQRCGDSFEISQVLLNPVVWWKGHEAGNSCAGRMATSW